MVVKGLNSFKEHSQLESGSQVAIINPVKTAGIQDHRTLRVVPTFTLKTSFKNGYIL